MQMSFLNILSFEASKSPGLVDLDHSPCCPPPRGIKFPSWQSLMLYLVSYAFYMFLFQNLGSCVYDLLQTS